MVMRWGLTEFCTKIVINSDTGGFYTVVECVELKYESVLKISSIHVLVIW